MLATPLLAPGEWRETYHWRSISGETVPPTLKVTPASPHLLRNP